MNEQFEAGGLFSTDVESVDLGEHHGLQLEGRVVRRTFRFGFGGRRGVRFELARVRPTSIRAIGPAGTATHRLPPNPDPWLEALQRLIAIAVVTALLPRVLRRRPAVARAGSE